MADEKQLEILLSGVEEWNQWREENSRIEVDLRQANLPKVDLCGFNLQGAKLQEANLYAARCHEANFSLAELERADLWRASLLKADLYQTNLYQANLQGADLYAARLEKANLFEADLQGADLQETNFQGTNLQRAKLYAARPKKADLSEANLSEANLQGTDLQGANLSEANLQEANIQMAKLGHTLFTATNFLVQAKGLETCNHLGPSIVDHRTLELAQGQLPEEFLKGCGLKDWEIENAKLHNPRLSPGEIIDITYRVADLRTSSPIDVRPLFISYSHDDEAFVNFIEKKLDGDGIRYWRDTHNMTAGPVKDQIDAAIRLHQTVLLVLSENSLDSDWVQWEVDKARKIERELRKSAREERKRREFLGEPKGKPKDVHVLCPVALDKSWEDPERDGPLLTQIKNYNILDFSRWTTGGADEAYKRLRNGIATFYKG